MLEQVGQVGRRGPGTVAVVEDDVDELRERIAGTEVWSGGDPLQRQRGVGGRAETDARLRSSPSGAKARSTMAAISFALHGGGGQGDLTEDTK